MRKKILGIAVMAVVAVAAAWNINQSENEIKLSDLALDNVEALARWYGVQFIFEDETTKEFRFSGAVTKYRTLDYVFAMLPLQGLGQGAQPITSYNYGAKNRERVKKSFRLLLTISLIYSVVLWAFILVIPRLFVGMFTSDATLLDFTSQALRVYCGALFIFGIQIACQMTFVSIGSAVCSIIVAVLRKFVLLIPLIYILPQLLVDQTFAVYLAEPVADVFAVTFTAILFTIQFKKILAKLN